MARLRNRKMSSGRSYFACPERKSDAPEVLFDLAIEAGISIAPGLIFSPCNRYRNFIRLSYGHPWSEKIDQSIEWLGHKVAEMAAKNR